MGISKSFGAYLKRLRESKGMSLRDVESKAGISSAYLSQIESGKRGNRKDGEEQYAAHPQKLRNLANIYEVEPMDLFERAGFFKKSEPFTGFPEVQEIDRCFDFVIHDPLVKHVFTKEDKQAIIQRYEDLTNKQIITWAGEESNINDEQEYKGIRLDKGVLYAESVYATISLTDGLAELGIDDETFEILYRNGWLKAEKQDNGKYLFKKNEIRQTKFYLMKQGIEYLKKERDNTLDEHKKEVSAIAFKPILEALKKERKQQNEG